MHKFLVSFRNGLDTRDQGSRGVAHARRLQPLHGLRIVSRETIEIGIEGFRFRAERLDRRCQPAIGRSEHRREVCQRKYFDETQRSVGAGTPYGGEGLLLGIDLGALRVEVRGVGEALADVALGRVERLERRDDLGERRRCSGLHRRGDARRIGASRRFAGVCRSGQRFGSVRRGADREQDNQLNADIGMAVCGSASRVAVQLAKWRASAWW